MRRTGAIGARIVPVLVTLVLATWDQRLPDRPSGVLASRLLKRKGNRRETEGERNRTATAEGTEPENAGRRETGRRRAKGKNPAGQPGNRRKARTGPEDVR